MRVPLTVPRLSYVVLRCADLERSRQFYESIGLRLVAEQHGTGAKHYSCDLGGVTLELYPFAGKSTSGLRIGLVVPELQRVVEALRSSATVVSTNDSNGTTSATVTDPDGHQISLEERRAG